MNLIAVLVFGGGGTLAVATIVLTLTNASRAAPPAGEETRQQRWRRVHIEGDQRRPYSELSRSDAWSAANFKIGKRA